MDDSGEIRATWTVERLMGVLEDRRIASGDRKQACKALAAIGDASAIAALIMVLRDPDEDMRFAAMSALRTLGDQAVEPLVAAL